MNAKHIIREEGRERRRRGAGGKQRTEIGKKKKRTRLSAIQPKVTNEGLDTDRWTHPGNREQEVRRRDLAGNKRG